MSSKLHGLVWEGCAFTGMILSRVTVMARLADFSNEEGYSWPAIETIRRQIGAKSENTVISAIKELERDGWLVKQERKVGNRNLSNVYRLNVDKLERTAEAARKHYRKISRSQSSTSIIEGSIDGGSTVEGSNIEGSNFGGSNIEKKGEIDPSTIAPDPSLKTDPSDKRSSCPDASQPDEPKHNVNLDDEFLSRHPDAVVFSPKKRQWGSVNDLTCAKWIWQKVLALYEQAAESDGEIARPKEPNWVLWANEIRLMCAQDGRTHRQICELFSRANRDPFWCRNVLSPAKLREQWDQLTLKFSNLPLDTANKTGGYESLDFDSTDWLDGVEDKLRDHGVFQ